MNKFNKRRGNAVKAKKIEKRVMNKRNKLKQKHEIKKVLVSGKRTGKAMRRREKAERSATRQAIAKGEIDLEMGDGNDS